MFVVLGESLHEFEAYATSAKMLEWERIIWSLGVEYGHSWWHHLVGNMIITDDEIYAKALGIFYLLDGLDAAIEDNNEFYTCFMGKVYSLLAYSIAFVVPIGYVVVDIGIELLQKLIHQVQQPCIRLHRNLRIPRMRSLRPMASLRRSTAISISFIRNGLIRSASCGSEKSSWLPTLS